MDNIRSRKLFSNVTYSLLLINVIMYALQVFIGNAFTNALIFSSTDALSRPWMLITYMFLHGSPYHLLFNMYALLLFGTLIEQRIGSRRFLFIYFVSGLLAVLPYLLVPSRSLGASGAVMGIIGVTIMIMPDLQLLLFFAIPMKLRTAAFVFVAFDLWGLFFSPGVANFAHIIGLICGLGYGWYLIRNKRRFAKSFSEKSYKSSPDLSHKSSPTSGHSSGSSSSRSHVKEMGYGNKAGIEMSEEDMENYIKYGRI